MTNKIDFVLTWVDGNDPEWQKEKAQYQKKIEGDNRSIRFRDWDNLQYWFRAIEQFCPWVNKIHFVTWGHLPKWLNINHPKLNIVKHTDFLNEDFLPTFNSRAIEVNLHRITGLSERFVYFNDDTFITKPMKEIDFFKQGLPRDVAIPNPCSSNSRLGIGAVISNNMEIINTTFNKRNMMRKNFTKWFNPLYGKQIIAAVCMMPWKDFTGFLSTHIPHSYLKSTFKEVWEKEHVTLEKTSQSKFRDKSNVNQWLMRYWQLASGNFVPRNINDGKIFMLNEENLSGAINAIKNQKYKMICINDTVDIVNFEVQKEEIKKAFDEILPEKSLFEL